MSHNIRLRGDLQVARCSCLVPHADGTFGSNVFSLAHRTLTFPLLSRGSILYPIKHTVDIGSLMKYFRTRGHEKLNLP